MNDSSVMNVEIRDGRTRFKPGQMVSGEASWHVEGIKSVEVRLFWYTSGIGTRDAQIIESRPVDSPAAEGRTGFSFQLPEQPYSFSGQLISLKWAIELVIQPGDLAARAEISVAPGGREIVLGTAPADA